jgi:hypothetical protein
VKVTTSLNKQVIVFDIVSNAQKIYGISIEFVHFIYSTSRD